jgi:hypothetical protein
MSKISCNFTVVTSLRAEHPQHILPKGGPHKAPQRGSQNNLLPSSRLGLANVPSGPSSRPNNDKT